MLSFDMFGQGNNEGETTFHSEGCLRPLGTVVSGPALYDLHGSGTSSRMSSTTGDPAAWSYVRNPQIRWMPVDDKYHRFAIAIEKPFDDVDPGQVRIIDPALEGLQGTEKIPDLTAHFRVNNDWGHFQVAALFRRIGFETLGTPDSEPNGEKTGWGVNVTTSINVADGNDQILVGGVYGEGIASYMNDGGTDLAGAGTLADPRPKASAALGVRCSTTTTSGKNTGPARSVTAGRRLTIPSCRTTTRSSSVSTRRSTCSHSPDEHFTVGAEGLWGEREDKNGANGDDSRIQVTFRYNFATTVTRH